MSMLNRSRLRLDTQVIEFASKVITRSEPRERAAAITHDAGASRYARQIVHLDNGGMVLPEGGC